MHVEFLVEEPSAEAALSERLPGILRGRATWTLHVHQGKSDLLAKLPGRLRGYAPWLPADWYIVVLLDEDRQDCLILKRRMEEAAQAAGLNTRGLRPQGGRIQVVNRVAVEELEAWFFGDVQALCAAYPRIPATLDQRARYSNPDAITGGTWESLERELQRVGYHRGGLPKIEAARAIARHMQPDRNRSRSFRCFHTALAGLLVAHTV